MDAAVGDKPEEIVPDFQGRVLPVRNVAGILRKRRDV